MIISSQYGFVFVHIPKCAGTSIRAQIVACDPTHVALAEPGGHPVLGQIDYGHIPLSQLREHFPDHYASVVKLPAFAVVRDPLSRFGSAFRQLLWQYEQTAMTMVKPETLRRRVFEAMDRVEAEIDAPSHQMIFFSRQCDFVYDDGQRLVDHLVPIENVGAFIAYLSKLTGVAMDTDRRSNQNVDLRYKWLGPLAFKINAVMRRHMPQHLHARAKSAAVSVLASRKSAAETSGILDMPEVQDFVARVYADDLKLYQMAQSEAPHLIAGFERGQLTTSEQGVS